MNTFGTKFRISIFGESHGEAVGIMLDGVRPGIRLSAADFERDIARRKPGATGTSTRVEADLPQLVTGVYQGHTTGAPLCIMFKNQNIQSAEYQQFTNTPRPSHADFVAGIKYQGFNDPRGGGQFSGRLTLPLVAAGVVAKLMVQPIDIRARLVTAGGSTNPESAVAAALADNDSVGGIVECVATNMPVGLGNPFFDPLESTIAHLAFAIPGIRGIEFGAGFAAAHMRGSRHNDPLVDTQGTTATNNAGGVVGGISNGNPLIFRVAVKPTASIAQTQQTINLRTGKMETLNINGRHDACFALRVPVIVEAIAAIALANA